MYVPLACAVPSLALVQVPPVVSALTLILPDTAPDASDSRYCKLVSSVLDALYVIVTSALVLSGSASAISLISGV